MKGNTIHMNCDLQLFPHQSSGSCIRKTLNGSRCGGRIGGSSCVRLDEKTHDDHFCLYGYCCKHSGLYSEMSYTSHIHEFKKLWMEERIANMENMKTPLIFLFKIGEGKNWLDKIYEEFQKDKDLIDI